jgi:hypothetical protein
MYKTKLLKEALNFQEYLGGRKKIISSEEKCTGITVGLQKITEKWVDKVRVDKGLQLVEEKHPESPK